MQEVEQLNERLKENGLLPIAVVDPKDCIGAEVNARYFLPETFNQLVNNVKRTGNLESTPLVYVDPKLPKGKYRIVSGHHRIESAKEAGLSLIMVMIMDPESEDEIKSTQLAHNSLVGTDDEQILAELFESIQDVSLRIASGLNDKINKINYSTINFRVGTFKEFSVVFLPEDVGIYDEAMEKIAEDMLSKSQAEIRLASMEYYDRFTKAIMKVKKVENIKSNGVALMRMIELAEQQMMV